MDSQPLGETARHQNSRPMKCQCGWAGPLGQLQYEDKGWTFTLPPMCIICRMAQRRVLRERGIRQSRVVTCRT